MHVFLETARLVLRRFTATDVDHLVDLDSDPEVMRYLNGGRPTPREIIQHVILPAFLSYYEPNSGLGVFAAIEKGSGEFLGWFGFRPKDAVHPNDVVPPGEVALGYRLRRIAWGQGYATEGARALIRKGFTELGVQRVVATIPRDNLASRRVMEKAGLSSVRPFNTNSHDTSEELWDGEKVEYGLLKADWEQQEAASGEQTGESRYTPSQLR
ncbi:MAG TPA: GNAT family N-acetyltransferase [Ktedonobacteraceae bacterium]|nr:GNAT family N-acetyltransferase [Ktedonobacteraceae bacterium]